MYGALGPSTLNPMGKTPEPASGVPTVTVPWGTAAHPAPIFEAVIEAS